MCVVAHRLVCVVEDEFRAVLVEFEREYGEMRARLDELEPTADKRDKDLQRVEARNRSLERRNEELSRALREMERTHQTLGLKVGNVSLNKTFPSFIMITDTVCSCNKCRGMCYPVSGMVHIKEPLLLIKKSSPCGGS